MRDARECGVNSSNRKVAATALIVLLIATMSSVALHGFDYPVYNNLFHVPIVLDFAGSAEGPADLYIESLDRYVSGVWVALSLVATESNIYALFLGLHIIVRVLVGFMMWRISSLLGGNRPVTIALACFLLFFDTFLGNSKVGHNDFLAPYLTQTEVVVPIVMGSWWLTLRGRHVAAAGLLGLAFNVNAFIALWAALAGGVAMVVDRHNEAPGKIVATAAKMAGMFALVASPTAIWIFSTIADTQPYPHFSFGQYLRDRYPFHTFIDVQVPETVTTVLFIAAGFMALRLASDGWSRRQKSIVWSLLCTLTAVFAFGMVLPYVTDMRLLLLLYPLRMDTYVVFLLGIVMVAWAGAAYAKEDAQHIPYSMIGLFSLVNGNVALLLLSVIAVGDRTSKAPVSRFWPAGLWIAVAVTHLVSGEAVALSSQPPAVAAITLVLQGAVVACFLARKDDSIAESFVFVSVCALGVYPAIGSTLAYVLVAGAYAAALLCGYGMRPRPVLALIAPLLLVIASIPSINQIALLIGVLLMPLAAKYAVPFLSKRVFARAEINVNMVYVMLAAFVILGPADLARRGGLSQDPEETRLLAEAQLWARRNIPAHRTVLAVGVNDFSTLSRRPVWVDWKLGNVVLWAPETYATWSSRWAEMKRIRSIVDAEILATREGIDYIVYDKDTLPSAGISAECVLFENERYWIMKSCPGREAGRQDR